MKKILLSLAAILALASNAYAGTCETSLMPAFTFAQARALCVGFGSSVKASLIPSTTNTIDLGSSSLKFRSGYFGTSVLSPLITIGSGAATEGVINIGTTAGTDNGSVCLSAGGNNTCDESRGGYFKAYGKNDAGQTGGISIGTSSGASGAIGFRIAGSSKWTIASTGTFTSATSFGNDIGWALVSGANTACNTTCSTGCVFGQDTATFAIVNCANAIADVCICAGAT